MDDNLSRTERRFQIPISTIFTVSVTVFGAVLIGTGIVEWANGEIVPHGGIASLAFGAILGCLIGIRPLWNQFAPPRR